MICIDPGASGGIVQDIVGVPLAVSMPETDGDILTEILDANDGESAYIEDLVKFAGRNMPSSRMAVYAANWGFLKGVLMAKGYRVVIVPPKKWQAALGLGSAKELTKTQWKNKLKNMAQQLYPKVKVTLATADALLIYEAARRDLLG